VPAYHSGHGPGSTGGGHKRRLGPSRSAVAAVAALQGGHCGGTPSCVSQRSTSQFLASVQKRRLTAE